MARRVIDHLQGQFTQRQRLPAIQLAPQKARCQLDVVAQSGVIDVQQMWILVAQREGAGGGGRQHRNTFVDNRLTQRCHVAFGLLTRLIGKTVGNQRDATAFLLAEELHARAHRVEHFQQIFP